MQLFSTLPPATIAQHKDQWLPLVNCEEIDVRLGSLQVHTCLTCLGATPVSLGVSLSYCLGASLGVSVPHLVSLTFCHSLRINYQFVCIDCFFLCIDRYFLCIDCHFLCIDHYLTAGLLVLTAGLCINQVMASLDAPRLQQHSDLLLEMLSDSDQRVRYPSH